MVPNHDLLTLRGGTWTTSYGPIGTLYIVQKTPKPQATEYSCERVLYMPTDFKMIQNDGYQMQLW